MSNNISAITTSAPVTTGISPTPSIYFASTDEILLTTFNSVVNQSVRLRGKFLDPDGNVVPLNFTWTPPADRSQHLASFTPGEGFLHSIEILPDTKTRRGQLWVRVEHRRVAGGVTLFMTTLAQGYVSTDQPLNWPGWNIEHSTSGRGVTRILALTGFPKGSFASVTVPTNAIWYITMIFIRFQTDSTAVNRYVVFRIYDPDGQQIYNAATYGAVGANSINWTFLSTAGVLVHTPSMNVTYAPLPVDTYLPEGYTVTASATNMQNGDQFTHFSLHLEEWINP